MPLNLCLQDMVYRRWNARTTAPSTTRPSLPNLPKTGNSNMLPVVPSMPNPMEKRKELFKQRRTCCRRRVTLRKLFLHIDLHPCKVERARLNYFSFVRFDAPFLATGSERKVKERSSKNSITTHGTESRSYTNCSPAIECGSKVKTSQAQLGSSSRMSRALTQYRLQAASYGETGQPFCLSSSPCQRKR